MKRATCTELRPWIDKSRLVWDRLAENPSPGAEKMVLEKMSEDPSFGDDNNGFGFNNIWYEISKKESPEAVALLIKNPTKINKEVFSGNESDEAAVFLLNNVEYMDTEYISYNSNPIIARWFKERMASTLTHTIWDWIEPWRFGDSRNRIRTVDNAVSHVITEKEYILMHHDLSGVSFIESDEAMELLEENPDIIDWTSLSENPHPRAIALLEKNLDKIVFWSLVSANPGAATLLAAHLAKVCWTKMSGNPGAIEILLENLHKIVWEGFSKNTHPAAIALMASSKNSICWEKMSGNPAPEAVALIAANLDKADWDRLCSNPNPAARDLIADNILGPDAPYAHIWDTDVGRLIDLHVLSEKATPKIIRALRHDQICWRGLSGNSEAMALLEAHPENIDWEEFSRNPGIFQAAYDYVEMRAAMDIHREALAKAAFHPRRLARHLEMGGEIEDF